MPPSPSAHPGGTKTLMDLPLPVDLSGQGTPYRLQPPPWSGRGGPGGSPVSPAILSSWVLPTTSLSACPVPSRYTSSTPDGCPWVASPNAAIAEMSQEEWLGSDTMICRGGGIVLIKGHRGCALKECGHVRACLAAREAAPRWSHGLQPADQDPAPLPLLQARCPH